MATDPTPVQGAPGVYSVDNYLYGEPGALATYVVDADRPAVLDAGGANTVEHIFDAMAALDIAPGDLAYVLVTHLHLDHAGGAGHLAERCPNAEVVVHERGVEYLTDRERLDHLRESVSRAAGTEDPYGEPKLVPPERVRSVGGGETLDLGDRRLDVYDAPGHAPHHYVCFDEGDGTLYAADAVGEYYRDSAVPSTPPPSFDLAANLETIERLRPLDPERILYGHFGVGQGGARLLEQYAAELPQWVERIRAGRERHGDDAAAIAAELPEKWDSPTLERDVLGVLVSFDRGMA
jgi:glyoxylase-like metal-dependent hydrolase (beta-lactamase superfamily II)